MLVGTKKVYIVTKTIKDATSFMLVLTLSRKHENIRVRERKGIRILFVYRSLSTFISKDLNLLKRYFDVRHISLRAYRSARAPLNLFKLIKGVLWADVVFSWFVETNAFFIVLFSKIFRKKSVIVVGGYDVAKVPEIGYGSMLNPIYALRAKIVLERADKVLTVDESLKKDAIKNAGVSGRNIQTVPTGYDYEKFKPKGRKKNLVTAVGSVTSIIIKRKGFDTFIKTAEYLPNVKFILIGEHLDDSIETLRKVASRNVVFTGRISEEELIRYYQKAKVHCQLSRYEGLPNALCEAMLCECVPVGTKYCGIPTAIGETGFYVPYGDPKATARAVKKALKSNKGKKARNRIKGLFPMEKREKKLIQIIKEATTC